MREESRKKDKEWERTRNRKDRKCKRGGRGERWIVTNKEINYRINARERDRQADRQTDREREREREREKDEGRV